MLAWALRAPQGPEPGLSPITIPPLPYAGSGGWGGRGGVAGGLLRTPGSPDFPSIQALPSGPAFSQSFQGRLVSQGWVDGSQGKVPVGVDGEIPYTGVEWEGLLPWLP